MHRLFNFSNVLVAALLGALAYLFACAIWGMETTGVILASPPVTAGAVCLGLVAVLTALSRPLAHNNAGQSFRLTPPGRLLVLGLLLMGVVALSACASIPTAAQLRAAYCATVTDAGREVIADKATGRPVRLIACDQRTDLSPVQSVPATDALPADAGEPVAVQR